MGLLDKKTRIIDMQLTDHGRELLARNQLRVVHYAFSDELIDYSGSLSQSLAQSASLDAIVYKNFVPVETTSMRRVTDLKSFLYTCPEQRDALPPFTSNVTGALNLTRLYKSYLFDDFILGVLGDTTQNPDVVVITERDDTKLGDREAQYSAEQSLDKLAEEDPQYVLLTKN